MSLHPYKSVEYASAGINLDRNLGYYLVRLIENLVLSSRWWETVLHCYGLLVPFKEVMGWQVPDIVSCSQAYGSLMPFWARIPICPRSLPSHMSPEWLLRSFTWLTSLESAWHLAPLYIRAVFSFSIGQRSLFIVEAWYSNRIVISTIPGLIVAYPVGLLRAPSISYQRAKSLLISLLRPPKWHSTQLILHLLLDQGSPRLLLGYIRACGSSALSI